MANNLFEQLSEVERDVVALLVGADSRGPSFNNYARETPAFDGAFTMGDAARAYLRVRLAALEEMRNA